MTTVDRKQLEQWFVALKEAAKCVQDEYLPENMGADWDEEIAQMQAALAQPEKFWHHNCPDSGETATEKGKSCNWCGAVEAQPEQEPVAWMEKDVLPLTHIIKAVVRREKDETYTEPLYTTPPQRTWVGLTTDEIKEYLLQPVERDLLSFTRFIEAKLKEKNT